MPRAATSEVVDIHIRIPADMADDIRRLARWNDRETSGEIRRALRLYLQRDEIKTALTSLNAAQTAEQNDGDSAP